MNRIAGLIIVAAILSILILLMTPGCDTLVTEISHDTVTIAKNPTAEFSADKEFGCVPCTVKFSDQSDGPRNRWRWDFGDSTSLSDSSDQQHPTHIYDNPGLYDVTLRIDDDSTGGTDTEEKKRLIVVGGSVADFLARPDSGCAPLTVDFLPQNFGGIEKWDWGFGYWDSDSNIWKHDTVQFPVFEYKFTGIYVCTLIATGDPDCGDTVVVIDTITVMGCPRAKIGVADNGSYYRNARGVVGCIPFTVSFIDSSDPGDSGIFLPAFPRQWDFGNGSTSTFSLDSTLYNSAGVYWVKLSVEAFDTVGQDLWSGTDTDSIKVTAYDAVTADFREIGSRRGCDTQLPFKVTFQDWSIGNVFSWEWDFKDTNNTAPGLGPLESHEYRAVGFYDVELVVGALCGDSGDTVWDTLRIDSFVVIDEMPTAGFTMDVDTGCAPLTVTFTNTSTDTTDTPTWNWSFGDSLVSTQRDTTVTFDSNGKHIVTLVVPNGACTTTAVDTVFAGPVASFSADSNSGPAPLTVTFTDESVLADAWEWDFGVSGTSDTSSVQSPVFTFDSTGTYTVTMLVIGCSLQRDSTTIEIAVQ